VITNDGKQIIAKFLLGQAPSFATHIAAGCGPRAKLSSDDPVFIDPSRESLDFEVFRVPIISKGFVREGGQEKIVFKAEMPTTQRYLISEVGFYPAVNNSVAGNYDSKLLLTFSPIERWVYVVDGSPSDVLLEDTALDQDNDQSNIDDSVQVKHIYSDATIFNNVLRKERNESPRFINRALIISGSSTFIDENFDILEDAPYLENSTINFDLSRNSSSDKIKLALSVVSKEFNNNENPDSVRVRLELINNVSQIETERPKAFVNLELLESDFVYEAFEGEIVEKSNRYLVVEKTIGDFVKDDNFSFANINYIRIYTSVIKDGVETGDYYVIYDGMRLDNVSSPNPLYSLIGYNLIETQDGLPILKQENTSNYIEYRFGIGVQ
jgi:hypothetical protein